MDNKLNPNDEWLTLDYAVKPLLEFIKPFSLILCPFDLKESAYVKVLRNNKNLVNYTHIKNGVDFFNFTKEDVKSYDYIISNPPFSIRKQVINKLLELDRPFAILLPLVSITLKDFKNNMDKLELLIFNKRLKFKANDGIISKNPPSETGYICYKFLPNKIEFRKLEDLKWK